MAYFIEVGAPQHQRLPVGTAPPGCGIGPPGAAVSAAPALTAEVWISRWGDGLHSQRSELQQLRAPLLPMRAGGGGPPASVSGLTRGRGSRQTPLSCRPPEPCGGRSGLSRSGFVCSTCWRPLVKVLEPLLIRTCRHRFSKAFSPSSSTRRNAWAVRAPSSARSFAIAGAQISDWSPSPQRLIRRGGAHGRARGADSAAGRLCRPGGAGAGAPHLK